MTEALSHILQVFENESGGRDRIRTCDLLRVKHKTGVHLPGRNRRILLAAISELALGWRTGPPPCLNEVAGWRDFAGKTPDCPAGQAQRCLGRPRLTRILVLS